MTTDSTLLAEQIDYYRQRAAEYDQWWFRTGRFDRGEALNAEWNRDVALVERTATDVLDRVRPEAPGVA